MTDKKDKNTKSTRRWTENELELFAEVLVDPENDLAISLESLTLGKSANNEIFDHIKNTFEREMDDEIMLTT